MTRGYWVNFRNFQGRIATGRCLWG